jgi:hypothetical protein
MLIIILINKKKETRKLVNQGRKPEIRLSNTGKTAIKGTTYKLRNLNVLHLSNMAAEPRPEMFDYDFFFDGGPIECVIIMSCVWGSTRQSLWAWLYDKKNPDRSTDKPIGHLSMTFPDGLVSVSKLDVS